MSFGNPARGAHPVNSIGEFGIIVVASFVALEAFGVHECSTCALRPSRSVQGLALLRNVPEPVLATGMDAGLMERCFAIITVGGSFGLSSAMITGGSSFGLSPATITEGGSFGLRPSSLPKYPRIAGPLPWKLGSCGIPGAGVPEASCLGREAESAIGWLNQGKHTMLT